MKLTHHDLEIELLDEWWAEAGMSTFEPQTRAYRVDRDAHPSVREVRIEEIGPVRRNPGVAIFKDNEETSARERVASILRGFRSGSMLPPVEIVELASGSRYPYKLTHGAHRLYCSLAAGFSHVPTVIGFDWESLDSF